jgi:hypothetical protein
MGCGQCTVLLEIDIEHRLWFLCLFPFSVGTWDLGHIRLTVSQMTKVPNCLAFVTETSNIHYLRRICTYYISFVQIIDRLLFKLLFAFFVCEFGHIILVSLFVILILSLQFFKLDLKVK